MQIPEPAPFFRKFLVEADISSMAAMIEDKYLISFNLLFSFVAILQLLALWEYIPTLDIISSFAIASIALIALMIGLIGQYRNPIEIWGSATVSISLVIMTFFILPWSFNIAFAALGYIPYCMGLYRQQQESEKKSHQQSTEM
ncbi:MAG: hypothetical protein ACFFE6_06440 [Candidatus Thorarchaeota archaeon]